jgi:hypothetical protein
MKTKISIVIVLLGMISFSCQELDFYPLSEASSETWYSSDKEVNMALNSLYQIKYWETKGRGSYWTSQWTDDWTRRNYTYALIDGTINSETEFVNTWWDAFYEAISSANRILANIERAKDAISEEKMNQYIADARFIRASMYSKLIFLWGDVPFYTGVLSIDEAFDLGRTDKSVILQSIYDDFDFAIAHLPVTYPDSELKRATKGAALALKARIALYMGDWEIARDAAKACMDLGVYELHPDFSEYFLSKTKNSVESVFAIPASVDLNMNYVGYLARLVLGRNVGAYANPQPSWELWCVFLCTDGLPIDESPLFDPREPFKNRDPRCAATIVEFGTPHTGFIYQPHPDSVEVLNLNTGEYVANQDCRSVTQWASFNGLLLKKGVDEDWVDYKMDPDNIIIRYADVLLIYAEAKIELNDIDQSVLDAINKVRARAYKVDYTETSSYPEVTTTDQTELRRTLRIERRMEFAWEGLRYFDLIRWKLAEKVMNTNMYGMLDPDELREKVVNPGLWFFPEVPPIDEDGVADFTSMYNQGLIKLLVKRTFVAPKQYLWPIPYKDVQINENVKQNPGY